MNNLKFPLLVALFFALASLNSCQESDAITEPTPEISSKIVDKVASLELNPDEIEMGKLVYPDGTSEDRIIIEGDIAFTEAGLFNMDLYDGVTGEQYRTFNLVNNNRTVRVIGYTGGGGYGLSNKMRTALRWSVNNYNALNTGLNFTLTYGTNFQPYDMVVYRVPNGQSGGVAGFPSGGNPYKWIQIFSGMDNFNTNTVEHVITHEMGHGVGLRHTDWFSRQSCGQSGESANPDGAVHIPGTPTGFDPTSIMLACFSSNEDGEFNNNDRRALEFLY